MKFDLKQKYTTVPLRKGIFKVPKLLGIIFTESKPGNIEILA